MRGARHVTELDIWQIADQLRIETFKLTARPAFARDLKTKSQADDAVNSVCRNIAEGFGCGHIELRGFSKSPGGRSTNCKTPCEERS